MWEISAENPAENLYGCKYPLGMQKRIDVGDYHDADGVHRGRPLSTLLPGIARKSETL